MIYAAVAGLGFLAGIAFTMLCAMALTSWLDKHDYVPGPFDRSDYDR